MDILHATTLMKHSLPFPFSAMCVYVCVSIDTEIKKVNMNVRIFEVYRHKIRECNISKK